MEHSKKTHYPLLIFFNLILAFSCVPVPITSPLPDSNNDQPSTLPQDQSPLIDEINSIVTNSSCASYSWKNRGRAPAAYMLGMAQTFARSYCRLLKSETSPSPFVTLLSHDAGDAKIDALSHYSEIFLKIPLNISTFKDETIRSLYTLGMGLGMRESSGKYCEGRDTSASNVQADTAEAGLFQTSYNSISTSPELSKLYADYKRAPNKCLLEVFSSSVRCTSVSIAGSGPGADYQRFNKSCPAFATEYAMLMLRLKRSHYGPVNRREAEVLLSCNQMLKAVQELIESDEKACEELSLE